jgi:hypothetical protein
MSWRTLSALSATTPKRRSPRACVTLVDRGAWWELMAACARIAPGKEVHELDDNDAAEISQALRWPLRLYKEAVTRAIDSREVNPQAVARAEVFGGAVPS